MKRHEDGRFLMSLLTRQIVVLGDFKRIMLKNIYARERILDRNPEIAKKYNQFLDDYEK